MDQSSTKVVRSPTNLSLKDSFLKTNPTNKKDAHQDLLRLKDTTLTLIEITDLQEKVGHVNVFKYHNQGQDLDLPLTSIISIQFIQEVSTTFRKTNLLLRLDFDTN